EPEVADIIELARYTHIGADLVAFLFFLLLGSGLVGLLLGLFLLEVIVDDLLDAAVAGLVGAGVDRLLLGGVEPLLELLDLPALHFDQLAQIGRIVGPSGARGSGQHHASTNTILAHASKPVENHFRYLPVAMKSTARGDALTADGRIPDAR